MKRLLQSGAQRLLGFERYLFHFSRFTIASMKARGRHAHLFHFLDLLPRDGYVLDIGANIGIMTVLMARRVPEGHVVCYEPIAENFRALERICAHYRLDNVTLHQLALGDEDGELTMVMPVEDNVRMQGLSHAVTDGEDVAGERYTVPVRRLDEVEPSRPGRIAAIKVDVENYELFVFRGGQQLLAEHRPIVFAELWDNDRTRELLELFRSLDYSVEEFVDGALRPVQPGPHRPGDYFLMPSASV